MKIRGVAHRGYPLLYPENTMSSFKAAADLNFSHLELDVHLSKDGVPVVMHDATVDRMTNAKGKINAYTVDELKKMQVIGGETIPTLEEALKLAKGRMVVDIELKQGVKAYPGMEAAVLEVVRKLDMQDQVFYTSFDHLSMIEMRRLSAEADIGLLVYSANPSLFQLIKELNAKYLSMKYTYLTPQTIRLCEDRGIQLVAWTVNDIRAMKRLYRWSPSVLVCTNHLEKWILVQKNNPTQGRAGLR